MKLKLVKMDFTAETKLSSVKKRKPLGVFIQKFGQHFSDNCCNFELYIMATLSHKIYFKIHRTDYRFY